MPTALWRGSRIGRLRLASGLVLFAFAATHFLNHALGLVSLDAMLDAQRLRTAVTGSAPGSIVLLAALLVHVLLGFWSLAKRRSWSLPLAERVQIVTGLATPLLLLPHVVNTAGASGMFGVLPTYTYELARIWPATIVPQSLLLLLVWVHGCVGLHYWLRLSPIYGRLRPLLYACAVLVPFAALAGVSVQGRAVETMMQQPETAAAIKAETRWPGPAEAAKLEAVRDDARSTYAILLVGLAVASGVVLLVTLRRRRLVIQYVGGPTVRTEPGLTLLDVSRRHGVPHVSVCGGRGRCSTCRVLVLNEGAGTHPPRDAERRTLRAIHAGPHVRLACQVRPHGPMTVMPLLKPSHRGTGTDTSAVAAAGDGVERELAVLFVDLRGFTALTERKLPFDVIYILNQFFAAVGQPVEAHGGWIANTAGDGVIALFADDAGVATACRSALLAVVEIDRAVAELSHRLREETRTPLGIAMGLHTGPHVVGRVGFGESRHVSVVGLAINVTSRLEALAKQEGVQLAISGTAARLGGLDAAGLRTAPMEVRGLSAPLEVIFVHSATELSDRLRRTEPALAEAAAS